MPATIHAQTAVDKKPKLLGNRLALLMISILAGSAPAAVLGDGNADQDQPIAPATLVVKAARVYPVSGPPIENGIIVIRAGKIVSVGDVAEIPPDARIIELPNSVVTPGLIDAHAAIDPEIPVAVAPRVRRRRVWDEAVEAAEQWATEQGRPSRGLQSDLAPASSNSADLGAGAFAATRRRAPCEYEAIHNLMAGCPLCGANDTRGDTRADAQAVGVDPARTWAEQSSEITPHLRVIDSVNLLSNDFDRLLRSGVTTVWVSPSSASVIGMRGAIVKTGGPLESRVIRAAGAVKASMGRDPYRRGGFNRSPRSRNLSFHTRRPTTRMGVGWVFRKAFYDAIRVSQGLPMTGADQPPAAAVPVLLGVLKGEIPLRIQARVVQDIESAIRLTREFGLGQNGVPPFLLEEATEAYQVLPLLKANNIPVIYGPIFATPRGFRARTGEANRPRFDTARLLHEADITFALTAHDLRDEEGLVRQGMLAVRHGLPADAALRAMTLTPAELLRVNTRLGALSPGADADLVIWSGEPFAATTRPLAVIIDGRVVYEN